MMVAIYIVGFCVTAIIFGAVQGVTVDEASIAKGIASATLWPIFWSFVLFAAIGASTRKSL